MQSGISTVDRVWTLPSILATREHVVLIDAFGRPNGVVPKVSAHSRDTPLHLAFSCHVVRPDGAVLLTRRAITKRTWPGVWSNACCGHPQSGESLREAVSRRLGEELNLHPLRLSMAVPDFAYRAEMDDGTVEHELCPVVVAAVDGVPDLDPAEVDEMQWVAWSELCERTMCAPGSLSPWSVLQLEELVASGWTPEAWLGEGTRRGDDAPLDVSWGGFVGSPAECPPTDTRALHTVSAELEPLLHRFVGAKTEELVAVHASLGDVAAEVAALVGSGGKRLRPAFVYWGHRATGAAHEPSVMSAAAVVELLHTFALLHDDVMDRSDRRRGRPTAMRSFADRHVLDGRTGDSEWFGLSAAVLAGDLAFTWADELIDSIALPADAVNRARRVFTELRQEVMAGQYLDLLVASDPACDERAARRVALLKSARYTVTRPLLLGASLAPIDRAIDVDLALREFGDAVGLAFQLRDDVLGLFGDPTTTGKGRLDDIHGGKRTLLMLRAMRLATPAQRAVLDRSLGNTELDEDGAAEVRAIVARTGALASIEVLVSAQHALATRALEGLAEPARSALRGLASAAIRRHR